MNVACELRITVTIAIITTSDAIDFAYRADRISDDRAVENLLQRVADGVLSEDRREALEHLRDLLAESPQVPPKQRRALQL